MKTRLLLLLLFSFGTGLLAGANRSGYFYCAIPDTGHSPVDTLALRKAVADSLTKTVVAKRQENQKLVAALLAFPVPFGILGLHRIYLGTSPWVPVVYVVTLGGFGILPLMDFIAILSQNNDGLQKYKNNGKVFMWVK